MNKIKVKIKKVEGLNIPRSAHETDAGADIIATSEPKIVGQIHKDTVIWRSIDYIEYETNLFIAPESLEVNLKGKDYLPDWVQHYYTLIYPRSSISNKNLMLKNGTAIIDTSYRGMIKLRYHYLWQPEDLIIFEENFYTKVNTKKIYAKNDKIAQIIAQPNYPIEFIEVDELKETKRGIGGLGSTGN